MKKNKLLVIGIVTMLVLVSCTKNFDEINVPEDEIVVDEIDGGLLGQAFAQAQYSTVAIQYQVGQNLYADIYSQYFATTHPRFNSDQFSEISAWTNIWYRDFYSKSAPQLLFVEQFTEENSMPVENAIAKIWRVEAYHKVTDYFGPIIYSEYGNQETNVGFDSQESVYKDFFVTLDEAVVVLLQYLDKTSSFSSNDQIFNGDVNKWLAFANSLRLRLALRISYADPGLAQQEAEKAVAAGVISENSGNAGVLSTINSINNLSTWTYISEFRMSASMESVLNGFNDPRLSSYFNEAGSRTGGDGGYHGLRNGVPGDLKVGPINDDHSFVDTKWLPLIDGGAGLPSYVMNSAEVFFLRAEGALRGWNMNGTAMELYNEGIRMSLSEWTKASPLEIEAYINSTNTPAPVADQWNSPAMSNIPVLYEDSAGFETKLEQIITQKWIAIYPDGREAWAERRRTGYPRGYALINSLNPDVPVDALMRRLKFTIIERSTNTEAVTAAEGLLKGPDENYTRLWWDAKTISDYPAPTN